MASIAVVVQSNGKYIHQMYSCIYNPEYVWITVRYKSGHQRKKNTNRAVSVRASEQPFVFTHPLLQTEMATDNSHPNAGRIFGL
jgi:hypothetical protein